MSSVVLWVGLINFQFVGIVCPYTIYLFWTFAWRLELLSRDWSLCSTKDGKGLVTMFSLLLFLALPKFKILCPLHKNDIYIKTKCKGVGTSLWFPRVHSWGNWFSIIRISIICDQYLEFSIVPRDQLVCIIPVSIPVDVWLPCLCIIDPPWYPIHYPPDHYSALMW